jgi:phenylacetate-CoA ligase
LEGGILGRVDDMVIVRGVNLYPGAVEDVVRGVLGTGEYRVTLSGDAGLVQMELEVEGSQHHGSATEATRSSPSSACPSSASTQDFLPPSDWALPSAGSGDPDSFHEAGTGASIGRRLEAALERAFSLRIPVRQVPYGSLPRFELKARRWVRRGE